MPNSPVPQLVPLQELVRCAHSSLLKHQVVRTGQLSISADNINVCVYEDDSCERRGERSRQATVSAGLASGGRTTLLQRHRTRDVCVCVCVN